MKPGSPATVFAALAILIIPLLGLFNVHKSYAAENLIITCDEPECDSSSDSKLFYELNWYPGSTTTKQIRIINLRKEACKLTLSTDNETSSPERLVCEMNTAITSSGQQVFGRLQTVTTADNTKDLADLFNKKSTNLKHIPARTERIYEWTVTFDENAGNEYQGAQAIFDFSIDFKCLTDEEIEQDQESGNKDVMKFDCTSPEPDPDPIPEPTSKPKDKDKGESNSEDVQESSPNTTPENITQIIQNLPDSQPIFDPLPTVLGVDTKTDEEEVQAPENVIEIKSATTNSKKIATPIIIVLIFILLLLLVIILLRYSMREASQKS